MWQGAPARYGFHTNVATKPMVISTLVQAIREGLYVERDELCLSEYLAYEQRPNGSYGALPGHHDDLLMTRAIGLHICFREMPPRAYNPQRLRAKPPEAGIGRSYLTGRLSRPPRRRDSQRKLFGAAAVQKEANVSRMSLSDVSAFCVCWL